jgi:hypothetical protein
VQGRCGAVDVSDKFLQLFEGVLGDGYSLAVLVLGKGMDSTSFTRLVIRSLCNGGPGSSMLGMFFPSGLFYPHHQTSHVLHVKHPSHSFTIIQLSEYCRARSPSHSGQAALSGFPSL